MRKGGGKAKGSGFERQIAKDIIKAFASFGVTQRECWRSVNSGGHEIACGDLEMSDRMLELFPYAVECKFRKEIKWQNFLLNTGEESKWLTQAYEGAVKAGDYICALLVMKENHGKIYAATVGHRILRDQVTDKFEICTMSTWTQFLQHAVKVANLRNEKPREAQRRVHASRP